MVPRTNSILNVTGNIMCVYNRVRAKNLIKPNLVELLMPCFPYENNPDPHYSIILFVRLRQEVTKTPS